MLLYALSSRGLDSVWWDARMPLAVLREKLHNDAAIVGLLVNNSGGSGGGIGFGASPNHWYALRLSRGSWWDLNSMSRAPRRFADIGEMCHELQNVIDAAGNVIIIRSERRAEQQRAAAEAAALQASTAASSSPAASASSASSSSASRAAAHVPGTTSSASAASSGARRASPPLVADGTRAQRQSATRPQQHHDPATGSAAGRAAAMQQWDAAQRSRAHPDTSTPYYASAAVPISTRPVAAGTTTGGAVTASVAAVAALRALQASRTTTAAPYETVPGTSGPGRPGAAPT